MTMCCRVGNFLPKVCWRCGKFLRGIDEEGKNDVLMQIYVCNMLCFPLVPPPSPLASRCHVISAVRTVSFVWGFIMGRFWWCLIRLAA